MVTTSATVTDAEITGLREKLAASEAERIRLQRENDDLRIQVSAVGGSDKPTTNRHMALLNFVSNKIRSSLNLETVLTTIVRQVSRALDSDSCAIYQIETSLHRAVLAEQYRAESALPPVPATYDITCNPQFLASLDDGEAACLAEIDVDGTPGTAYMSQVVAPIIYRGERIGLILLGWCAPNHVTTLPDLELVEAVADQAAIAIMNARLFANVTAERNLSGAVLSNMGDGVIVQDADGNITLINRAAESFFGLLPGYVIGKHPRDVLPLVLPTSAQPMRISHAERVYNIVTSMLHDSDENINGTLTVISDITETARVERMKDEFVSLMGHELRTPLTSVCGALDLTLDGDLGLITGLQRDFLQIARINSARMVEVVNDMLDIWRIEAGRVKVEFEPFEIRDAVRSVAADLHPTFAARAITCDIEWADGENARYPLAYGDSHRIMQIIRHLLTNACKFSPEGGHIRLRISNEAAMLRVEVIDKGVGMSAEFQSQLFKKFFRADNTLTRRSGGIGLGLPIVRALVDLHGGTVAVKSVQGAGSTFAFTIPTYAAPV